MLITDVLGKNLCAIGLASWSSLKMHSNPKVELYLDDCSNHVLARGQMGLNEKLVPAVPAGSMEREVVVLYISRRVCKLFHLGRESAPSISTRVDAPRLWGQGHCWFICYWAGRGTYEHHISPYIESVLR